MTATDIPALIAEARRVLVTVTNNAMRFQAERDKAIAAGEHILADALSYRAALEAAYNAWHMETRGDAIDIIHRALNEKGGE